MSDLAYAARSKQIAQRLALPAGPREGAVRVPSPAQRQAAFRRGVASAAPNRTGLPDALKAGLERLSGLRMDDVRVHRNSPRPAQLGALAFAQGSQIHVAPGEERHLSHEAWHVAQQKQGRVKATAQLMGVALNDDPSLEREADLMGRLAASESPAAREQEAQAAPQLESAEVGVSQLARGPQRAAARAQYGPRSRYGRPLRPAAVMPLHVVALGNSLNVAFRRAGGNVGIGRNFVYLATQRGRVVYVGITNDVAARQAEHGDRFHLHQLNRVALTRIQVRAVEQFAINHFRRAPGNQNIANSIAATQPYYQTALRYGATFYRWILDVMRYLHA